MLSEIKVKRCIKHKGFGHLIYAQLHHCLDAREDVQGAVLFHRNDIHVAFLMGKARVTPLKTVTISCLELTAAVLAVRVNLMLKAELKIQLQESVFCAEKYKEREQAFPYVCGQQCLIRAIRGATRASQWRYVSSRENPVDASGEVRVGDFMHDNRWIEGPKFLFNQEGDWPANVVETATEAEGLEVKKEAMVNVINVEVSLDATSWLMAYFSSWMRLEVS